MTDRETAGLEETVDEMERAVVGACLRDNTSAALIAGRLRPEHFRQDRERNAYAALLDLWGGGPVDVLSLAEELNRRKQLRSAADVAAIHAFPDAAPTARSVEYHAERVRQRGVLHLLAAAADDIKRNALDPFGPAEEVVEASAKLLHELIEGRAGGGPASLAQAMDEACDALDERSRSEDGLAGLSTGLKPLDDLLAGLRPGEQTVLAARPSVGKTAMACGIALQAARRGAPVLFVSLEQPRVELAERLLCREAPVNSYRILRGRLSADDASRIAAARERLRPAPLWIADGAGQTVLQIAAAARRMKASSGLGLIVVDYLQLVAPDDRRANRNEQVGSAARRLRELGRESACPVLLLCQLNREADREARPKLSHLRDSGEIEQHADCVVILHRTAGQAEGPLLSVEAFVEKHRNGPTGRCDLVFRREYMRFEDAAPPSPFQERELKDG